MSDFNVQVTEIWRDVLFPLPPGVTGEARRVGVRRIVLGTRYAPACALVALLCASAISWTCPDVVGWYIHDFLARNMYTVPPRRSKQEMSCSGLVPYEQMGPRKLEAENQTKSASKRLQRETELAAVENCRRRDRAEKARKKGAILRPDENILAARENVTRRATAA